MSYKNEFDYFEVFPWNKNFETGHEEIDTQHKELVKLLNDLALTLTFEDEIDVNDAFTKLAQYAEYHFIEEEKIWSDHFKQDSWSLAHHENHASFLPKVIEIKEKNADKPLVETLQEIIQFLIRWLAFHIIDEDKRMALAIANLKEGHLIHEAKALAEKEMNGSMKVLIETVLSMYEGVSSRTINLMKERNARKKAEKALQEANNKLQELSITDQLTQLYNRRHFDSIFEAEFSRAKRMKSVLSLISFDIDYFKKINDFYGHIYGDKALEAVGQCLKSVCRRPYDFVF